jgi:D-alanyl-D-alanine carboxypeptidase (penicillin-binding protein 5/6)
MGAVNGEEPDTADTAVPAPPVPELVAPSVPEVVERPQHTRRRRNRRRMIGAAAVTLVLVLVAGGLVVHQRVTRPLAEPAIPSGRATGFVVPGSTPAPPWPASGQAAVSVPALGYLRQSGPESPVPIASLAKMATAVVVLRDHPVRSGSSGPTLTMTAADAGQFDVDLDNDETNIPLQAGEKLTELQLLEALLNQSANDAAFALATWDAGSPAAFTAKMNTLARSLGADHTQFVDVSGFDPGSVSTAADMLRIAAAGMAIPTFASVAAMPTVTLPLVGTVHNIVKGIGTDGIVGVKSGYTSQASGCMVLATYRSVDGRSVLVLAAALGQREPTPPQPKPAASPGTKPTATTTTTPTPAPSPTTTTTTTPYSPIEAQYPLLYTGPIVERLLDATGAAVVAVPVTAPGRVVATATVRWGGDEHRVPAVAARGAWLLALPGQRVTMQTAAVASTGTTTDPRPSAGVARFTVGTETAVVPVRLAEDLPDPSWWWKVLHN